MQTPARPTICFATMCKNEEHCIRDTLESVHRYIDTWVVCDTGSTDRTCEIVREFFAEKGIPGELFVDGWTGFDVNKTLMMSRAYNRSDYVLHLDADDRLMGEFVFPAEEAGKDAYYVPVRREASEWKATVLYNNRVRWKFCGVAHTIIRCLDKPTWSIGDLSHHGFWISGEGIGSRAFDPKKYLYDAERLQKQFFDTLVDDPDGLNSRSAFYTAQSYMDSRMPREALQWYRLYLRLKDTWIEEVFEAHMRVGLCLMALKRDLAEVVEAMNQAIQIFPDRAEPHFHLGRYLNQQGHHESAYAHLKAAASLSLAEAKKKYILFVNDLCYGSYLLDELSVACYWTGRLQEGLDLALRILEAPEMQPHRARIETNIGHFRRQMAAAHAG